jgi:hypothetical protein
LLNLFLDDCKDAQDLGTRVPLFMVIILIALVGWKHPKYNMYSVRELEKCHVQHSMKHCGTQLSQRKERQTPTYL